MNLTEQTIAALAPRLQARAVSVQAVTEAYLARIAAVNPAVNAFITVLRDDALAQARDADREIARGGYRGPLHGIPISIKDVIDLRGQPTTAASRVRAGHRASADAPVIARLREAGAIFVGKCNLHEFAFGTTTDESAFGATHNPRDLSRLAGGSSGGSAAAVAADMSLASIGTDTGGSIRIPAAACGVVGLKPTFGELSCEGIVPLARSLDHIGPMTKTVEDAWLVFEAMRGQPWPRLPAPRPLTTIRLGIVRGEPVVRIDEAVVSALESVVGRLRSAGVEVDEVSIRHGGDAVAMYVHLSIAEGAAYHAHTLDRRPGDYMPGVRLRLELGRYVLAEDYVRAQSGRAVLRAAVDEALDGRDALVLPTVACVAPPLGARDVTIGSSTEPVRNAMLRLTPIFNLTHHPAISLPCGQAYGLPCGLQLIGRRGETSKLLAVAAACEPYVSGSP